MIGEQTAHTLCLTKKFKHKTRLLVLAKLNIDYTLELNLSRLINKTIPSKNIQKWVEKNISFLNNFIDSRGILLPSGLLKYNTSIKHNNKPVSAIISNTSKLPYNYHVLSSSLLSGEGVIPNLWMYLVIMSAESAEPVVSYDLAHDDFILISLSVLFAEAGGKLLKHVESFYINNKQKIDNLKKSFKERPKLLGKGVDGAAFSVGPNLVLKIFKEDFGYLKAKEAMQRLHQFPELSKTEAMIYDVDILGEYQGYPVYYYIMEKMKPVYSLDPNIHSDIRIIADAIGDYIYMRSKEGKLLNIKNNIEKYTATKKSREELLNTLREMNKFIERFIRIKFANNVKKINESLQDSLDLNWLKNLIEEITMKFLTRRGDLDSRNLGLTNYGMFRYYDPSWHGFQTKLNIGDKFRNDTSDNM